MAAANRWYLLAALIALVALSGSATRVRRIVGGQPAELPPKVVSTTTTTTSTTSAPDATTKEPLVFVRRDKRSALVNGIQNRDGTYSFLGIRYAEPPVRRLRFQRPRKLKLKGVVNAQRYGPPCPQWYNGRIIGNEDCLFLNIYTPEVPLGDGRPPPSYPVLVWIHGGNFQSGSASQYLPKDIVRKGVVVVTVQYRLGSLGFLSIGRKELPGNMGMFDIATAIRWVGDYIRFFGGNPKRIITSGHGSGGSCAAQVVFNKVARKLVKGVFAMSGTPVSPFTLDENESRTAKEVAEIDGCNMEQNMKFVRCMQNLSLETILKGDSGLQASRQERYDYAKEMSNVLVPGPSEEGKDDHRFLPNFILQSPLDALKEGNFPEIPLLTGVTKQETGAGVRGNLLDSITQLLTPQFLKGDIYKDCLNANTGLFVNKSVNPSLAKLFSSSDYLQFFSSVLSSSLNQLQQVIQHTTDAFFNLPAFITSHLWTQKNKAYLYSFEHNTQSEAGKFLQGNLLYSNGQTDDKKDGPTHGDDLQCLFELQSLEGKPLQETAELNEPDQKVKDHFTTMVAEFAKSGVPKTNQGESWAPFTKDGGEYMIIKETPTLAKGFRKCSMGLWTGDSNILNSAECALSEASKIVTNTLGAAGTQLLNTATAVEGVIGGGLGNVTTGLTKVSEGANKQVGQLSGLLKNTTSGAGGGLLGTTGGLGSQLGLSRPKKKGGGGLFGIGK